MDGAKQSGSSVKIYSTHQSTVHEPRACSVAQCDPFSTNSGVGQGCPLSPLLFSTVFDDIICQLTLQKRGIVSRFIRHLEALDFSDDICLLSHKLSDM